MLLGPIHHRLLTLVHRLWYHRVTPGHTPRNEYLCSGQTTPLCHFSRFGIVYNLLLALRCPFLQYKKMSLFVSGSSLTVVSRWRVSGYMNSLPFAIFYQIISRQQRVHLELVHCWRLPRRLDDRIKVLDRKVAHTDGFDFARVAKSEHRLPCVYERGLLVDFDFFRIARAYGELPATSCKRDGPVNEIQVEVRGAKLRKRDIELLLNFRWMVCIIPEFRGDEEVLAPNHRGYNFLQSRTDLHHITY
jgi:hypothetical protein